MGKKRLVKPRFWVLMMTALVLVFTCLYISQESLIQSRYARIQELEGQRLAQLNENAELNRKIAFSKTDAYVERIARNELGMLYENEIRFVAGGQTEAETGNGA